EFRRVLFRSAGGAAVEPPFCYSPRRGPSHSGGNGARRTSSEPTIVIPNPGGRTAMRKVLGAVTALVFALGVATFIGLPGATAQGGGGTIEADVKYNGAPQVEKLKVNKDKPKFKKVMTEKLEKPEYVKLTCDVHSWMLGWVAVTPGPAAVTDANGVAKIENVPPGKQTVEVWHETLGKQTKDVEVKAGQTTKVSFEMKK